MAMLNTTPQARSSQGDGGYTANGMLKPPASQAPPPPNRTPVFQTHRPPAPQPIAGQPSTFAEMQANGQARPNPPTGVNIPQSVPGAVLPGQVQQALQSPSGVHPAAPGASMPPSAVHPAPVMPGYSGPAADGSMPVPTGASFGVEQPLNTAVTSALSQPSRYDMPQVQQVRDALTNQLNTQFGAQQKQLDEEMARRGIGDSSIASGYYGDLKGQQANALGSMNAALTQDFANTQAQDRSSALGSGLNLQQLLLGDRTANRGLDITSENNNNNFLTYLLQTLGIPTGQTGSGNASDQSDLTKQVLAKLGLA